ncbi:MAG: aldose 1-epimerase [Saprospiraceae bacterium]|jgi:aldose 1-epimerase
MNIDRFTSELDGKLVSLYPISNNHITCHITNYGARVVSLMVMDKQSNALDVVLGFDSLDGYINADEQYHGATVGRYANRIANGRFFINEKEYTLAINNPPDALHGGIAAMHNQVWTVVKHEKNKITLEYVSPHMEEGFPGELTTQVTYEIKGSDLVITYKAKSTEDTILNLTHHSYFNLNGEGSGAVLDHCLMINSEYYTPVNQNTIPTGKLDLVDGTAFDFTSKKKIGLDIEIEDEQLGFGYGFDHNYVVRNHEEGTLSFAAKVNGDVSGIEMEVWTTEPGVQFYSANHLSGKDIGKSGIRYAKRNAFCLETQHFPDSPNQRHFPSTSLLAGDLFYSETEYRFKLT